MPRSYVALDLETTGLDPDRDAIMEVGAVRFDVDGGCETFSTFVDPRQPISYRIERLTNICDADVAGAPLFANVAPDLEAFIGDRPIIGQNIAFDLKFLERGGVRPPAPSYDTQELASLLLPGLPEQNLRSIARYLGIDFPVQHRALADAEAARLVFLALRERLEALPPALLAEAERIASITDWPLRFLLQEVASERPVFSAEDATNLLHGAVSPPKKYGPPVSATASEPKPLDLAEVDAAFTQIAPRALEDFEERPEQLQMARAIAGALNDSEQLMVEAGTGIGKSLAYLLPAARHALRNNERVVISTNTINLQEQLMGQDIPRVRDLLEDEGVELRAAQLKGRSNYLCLLRWSALRRSTAFTADEAKLLVRLLLWLPHTDTGDRAELKLSQGEEAIWSRLGAQNEACLATPCAFVRDGSCYLLRARRRAEASHVLVVNHALLLSDVAVGGGVIPEYDHLIIDEAQHLESEATSQFGFSAREEDVHTLLDRIAGKNAGLVTSLRNSARGLASGLDSTRELLEIGADLERAAASALALLPDFFLRVSGFMRQQRDSVGDYDERLLLNRAMRVQPDWADIELAWEGVSAGLGHVFSTLQALQMRLQGPDAPALLEPDGLVSEVADLLQAGELLRLGIGLIVLRDDANTVCWLTQQRSAGIGLASAPLQVAELLQERLFSKKRTTVLTSATLTVENEFHYVRNAVGLEDARELHLGSPFDYANSTLVLVPTDMPEPNQPGYMAALQQALIELVRASQGRALVLFTSHSSLRGAYGGIKSTLEDEGILVLGHNLDGSPRQLLHALREQPHTVVLGTASFWEGIDVVGDALSLLVIARLPFSVPDDPVFHSRSELFDDPFNQYAVPQAVLRFKQGFGRLIRRKTDRGVMVTLDARIGSKSYGQTFLRSLPSCSVRRVRVREAPALVSEWLGDR
ncbi:MAG: helicase C-terminal domain-containing protein [Dehalococcoidia bacterium]